ncbi:hypothetical protein Tco_0488702 [Tanacetum coccineum]
MEAHCISLELNYQNHALKSGQHGQILNEASNIAKMKKEIDAYETINIELEHSVATLLKENETLQKHYKDLWIPTGKILASCTSKDDNEPTHGSNVDIPNIHDCKQTLDLRAGTSLTGQQKQRIDFSALLHLMSSRKISEYASLVNVKEVPTADMISMTSMIELESLFGPSFDEYFNGENQVVSKSFVVTTANASDKHQQQPDSNSSTSTLATTVSTDRNFDL